LSRENLLSFKSLALIVSYLMILIRSFITSLHLHHVVCFFFKFSLMKELYVASSSVWLLFFWLSTYKFTYKSVKHYIVD
jgi:hypothetical protein